MGIMGGVLCCSKGRNNEENKECEEEEEKINQDDENLVKLLSVKPERSYFGVAESDQPYTCVTMEEVLQHKLKKLRTIEADTGVTQH